MSGGKAKWKIKPSEPGQSVSVEDGFVLIAFFSRGGNTRGIAEEIRSQTGADIFEIELMTFYSTDCNTVLDQTQHDQNIQARSEIKNKVENFEHYDTILLGCPNWWASIPMPIASFLEEYDFFGKTLFRSAPTAAEILAKEGLKISAAWAIAKGTFRSSALQSPNRSKTRQKRRLWN